VLSVAPLIVHEPQMRGHWGSVYSISNCLRTLSVCHERPQHCLLAVSTPEHLQGSQYAYGTHTCPYSS
jgi:hypothetical protein